MQALSSLTGIPYSHSYSLSKIHWLKGFLTPQLRSSRVQFSSIGLQPQFSFLFLGVLFFVKHRGSSLFCSFNIKFKGSQIAIAIFLLVQKHTEHSNLLKEPYTNSCHAFQQGHLRMASPNRIRFNCNALVQQWVANEKKITASWIFITLRQ